MSNQKHCRSCRHLDCNTMSDEMYCKLKDYEPIRLRWDKQRPDWCPLVTGGQKGEPSDNNNMGSIKRTRQKRRFKRMAKSRKASG